MKNKKSGSDTPEIQTKAIKQVIVRQLQEELKKKSITKMAFSQQMKTSRASLDRLLDIHSNSTTLASLQKAATALGKELKIEFV